MKRDHIDLSGCSGERLLLLRVFRPWLKGLIDQELEHRGHLRRFHAEDRRGSLRLVRQSRVA